MKGSFKVSFDLQVESQCLKDFKHNSWRTQFVWYLGIWEWQVLVPIHCKVLVTASTGPQPTVFKALKCGQRPEPVLTAKGVSLRHGLAHMDFICDLNSTDKDLI